MNFRRLTLLVFVLSALMTIRAQAPYKPIPTTPHQDATKECLLFPSGDTLALEPLFNFLDEYMFEGANKKFTILHMGGSHIQAGVFTNRMRNHLLTLYPAMESDRGILFPFSLAGTNNQVSFKTNYTGKWSAIRNVVKEPKYKMGLAGFCAVPSDTHCTFTITVNKNDSIKFDFTTITLLGYSDSSWVYPQLCYHDSVLVQGKFDEQHLAYIFELDTFVNSFKIIFAMEDSLWQDFYLRGVYLENHQPGLSYVDIGVNGAAVPSYLRCEWMVKDLELLKPDMCIFSIGINDASGTDFDTTVFINNYKALINRIRSVSPHCILLFTTNNDSYRKSGRKYYNNKNGYLAEQAFITLAKYYHTAVFDWFDYMGGLTSMADWEKAGLAKKDKVHFTTAGYNVWGDVMFNAVLKEYEKHLKRQSGGME